MFEAYTDTARRIFLFGRYEASHCGSESTEIDHLVLGFLRADLPLATRLFKTQANVDQIRSRIIREIPRKQPPVSLTAELPLSDACKLAVSHAAAEAERLHHKLIAPQHLLAGILRENTSIAAGILLDSGVTIGQLEKEEGKQTISAAASSSSKGFESLRDLVSEARFAKPTAITGRNHELDQLIQALCRRTKNSVFLVGEPGVGKDALVRGLAHRIAEGNVPPDLADRPILLAGAFDALPASRQRLFRLGQSGEPIIYVPGLLDLHESMPDLVGYLKYGKLQLIATAAPLAIRLALDRKDELVRHFEFVFVPPPTEQEAVEIVASGKEDLERFHGVAISPEAMQMAISGSARFLPHRPMAERAIDLLDDAGAKVKIQSEALHPELTGIRKKLRAIAKELAAAVGNHEFELAKKLAQEEQEQSVRLDELRQTSSTTLTVTGNEVLEVIAARTSLTIDGVRLALAREPLANERDLLLNQLAARIPPGRRDWLEGLLAYLTDCSAEDAGHLLEAIKTVKVKLDNAS